MKMLKALLATLVILTFSSIPSFAETASSTFAYDSYQAAIEDKVENFVCNAYDSFYKINAISLSISDLSVNNNVITAEIAVSMNKTLKAKSIDEIPYAKGLKSKSDDLEAVHDVNAADAKDYVNLRKKDLVGYIGAAQDQNDKFRITASVVDGKLDLNNAKFEFLNGLVDWVPATAFIPASESAMIQMGYSDVEEGIKVIRKGKEKQQAAAVQAQSVTYNRLAASAYANSYTSEVVSRPYYDHRYWNPNYARYENDCANYVSQAIYAGGIPQDFTWRPGYTAWVNTGLNISGGLTDYMVHSKGYFYKTTKMGVSAGGFIIATTHSHAMFVVANDGVTLLLSSHTKDRKQASFADFDSSFKYYYISSTIVSVK
ncbi:amidase domain-containing protein [Paenibacillus cremeus]|uniref:Putative amidase domain-containing protein n=1 Tax=Paenibacillus cremeus TaxID=2163881 RepID=A0A559JGH3_9BACL|nr:amidase domain-containing protein [Paenibacillus cremeus]TVX98981.1 hypothetical protein FPZ49_34260 [Paenibacillus cremeus]